MKQRSKCYSMCCIILLVCVTGISCSKDLLNDNIDHVSDTIIDTIETESPDEVSVHRDEISEEFLHNFYEFVEHTWAYVLRESDGGNQLYAPFNSYLAFSMLNEIAEGEAKEEIQEVLGISDASLNSSEVNTAINTLENQRLPLGRLSIKSSLWLNAEINYEEEILNQLQSQYRTEIYQGDLMDIEFQNKMSKWVFENTNYEFQPDYNQMLHNVDPYAFISLNTIDFYNEWSLPFEEKHTTTEAFILSNHKEISCDFMKLETSFHPFIVGEDYISTVSILKGNESMLFILPEEGLSVEEFIENKGKLSSILSDWTNDQYSMGKVKFSVPKFAYESEINLKSAAEAMGIKKIFDNNARAFSEFANLDIYITDITQASKIEIDEMGCSASSYTEIRAAGSGVSKEEVEINLNRPFIYILYKNKVPFLVGVVGNPLE